MKSAATPEPRAIPFIAAEPTGHFRVTDEAKTFLSSIDGPVAVVAVAGLYRTGKSFLLNRMLLNRDSGFGVGGSVNACTQGIWIWSQALRGHAADGRPIQIVVLDTEGLGSLDAEANHDLRVFSLALLLASTFVYNSLGNIDEGALQSLDLLVNVSRHIQTKAKPRPGPVEELAQFFPSFLWVVRDFSLQLADSNGEPISPK